jgi:hypothetical protein
MNKNYNILYLKHLIYSLYVCTCVFLLHQESFDMILVDNPSFYDGGVIETTLYHPKTRDSREGIFDDNQRNEPSFHAEA